MTPNEIWRELTHPQRMQLGHHVAMNERCDDGRLQVIPNNAIVRRSLLAKGFIVHTGSCLLYTSPSPRDRQKSRLPSSA